MPDFIEKIVEGEFTEQELNLALKGISGEDVKKHLGYYFECLESENEHLQLVAKKFVDRAHKEHLNNDHLPLLMSYTDSTSQEARDTSMKLSLIIIFESNMESLGNYLQFLLKCQTSKDHYVESISYDLIEKVETKHIAKEMEYLFSCLQQRYEELNCTAKMLLEKIEVDKLSQNFDLLLGLEMTIHVPTVAMARKLILKVMDTWNVAQLNGYLPKLEEWAMSDDDDVYTKAHALISKIKEFKGKVDNIKKIVELIRSA